MYAAIAILENGGIRTLGNFESYAAAQQKAEQNWARDEGDARVYVILDLSNPTLLGGNGPAAFVNTGRKNKPQLKWGGEV